MNPRPEKPEPGGTRPPAAAPKEDERGTNAVEHRPDPAARPLPDGEHKYVPGSPYKSGND